MPKEEILAKTRHFVRQKLEGESSGHDWWHIDRVRNVALSISKEEKADLYIVELAALLHDIADWKFHQGDGTVGPKVAREWLQSLGADEQTISHVCDIIKTISFKGSGVPTPMNSKEGMVVQDADRLDALGAIGIARTFAYGGSKGRAMYDPRHKPQLHQSFEAYKNDKDDKDGHTINHFYEKLLLLKDRMNTETGKRLALQRHQYMEQYLEQFYREWEGRK